MAEQGEQPPPREGIEERAEGRILRGLGGLLKDLLKELLTGPVLVVSGLGIGVLGYFVGLSVIMSIGVIVILLGLGAIFVW